MKEDPVKKISELAIKRTSDAELKNTARRLEAKIGKLNRERKNARSFEEEVCYIQRELELRKKFGHFQIIDDANSENLLEFDKV